MPIAVLDVILIVVMLISAFLAMVRGFVREVLSIAAWVVAAVAAIYLYPYVLPYVAPYIEKELIATAVSAAAVFLVALIVVSYITMRISDFVLDSRVGALDRTLGFVYGAARGLLLVVVAMMFLNWFLSEEQQPQWITGAKSRPMLVSLGDRLRNLLPDDADSWLIETIKDKIRNGDETEEPGEPGGAEPADTEGAPPADQSRLEPESYDRTDRSGLDQLVRSSSTE